MFVKLFASDESVEVENVPDDHDKVWEVEDDEEEDESQ